MSATNGNPFSETNIKRLLAPPQGDTTEKSLLRQEIGVLLGIMKDNVPECAERTLAMRKMQEALSWCYVALDRHTREG